MPEVTRNKIMRPLEGGEGGECRFPATIGLLYRGEHRRQAQLAGIEYYEKKGWLDSEFIFRGSLLEMEDFLLSISVPEEAQAEYQGVLKQIQSRLK